MFGGLLYLCGLRSLQFVAAVFRFFTNFGAVFWFCRLWRLGEMDASLIRFSFLSYICSGFSVFEKNAVCGYFTPYYGLRFAPVSCSERLLNLVQTEEYGANKQCH